jgi:hypothetical protein
VSLAEPRQSLLFRQKARIGSQLFCSASSLVCLEFTDFIPLEWLKNQHSICLFKNITGHECYGCGMTRAYLSAMHFHFADAILYNKLFLIVLPLLIYIWAKKLVNLWPWKILTLNQSWK